MEDDVWIGMGAMILSGVKIGKGAVVAAGAIVCKDVLPYSIVGGSPAKFIRWRIESEVLRKKLYNLDLNSIPDSKIKENLEDFYAPLSESTFSKIVKKLTK